MSPATLLAQLRLTGVTLHLRPDGSVAFRSAAHPPAELLAQARGCREEIAALLRSEDAAPPDRTCPQCAGGLWWRYSAVTEAAGPWRCRRCVPPDRHRWIDASALPSTSANHP